VLSQILLSRETGHCVENLSFVRPDGNIGLIPQLQHYTVPWSDQKLKIEVCKEQGRSWGACDLVVLSPNQLASV
jgi:hypothetical protein